ncbi:MAG: hypothetical protein WC314_04705 [Vulcanimicrobiota bacterium]
MPTDQSYWVAQAGRVSLLPVLHHKVEFARLVREAITELSPDFVAVELPAGLERDYQAAVQRLPSLSYLTLGDLDNPGPTGVSLWKIEPTDAFCEAVRTAQELEIPVHFVDLVEPNYPSGWDLLPDPYCLHAIGLEEYYKQCCKALESSPGGTRGQLDETRETVMAGRLQKLSRQGRVLFLGGLKHIEPLRALLEGSEPPYQEDEKVDSAQVQTYHPTLRTVRTLADELPFVMTLYELQRGGPGPDIAWHSPEPEKTEEKKSEETRGTLSKDSIFGSLSKLLGMKVTPEALNMSPEQLRKFQNYLNSMKPEAWKPPSFQAPDDDASQEPPPIEPPDTGVQRYFTYKNTEQRRGELLQEYGLINANCRTARGALDRQTVYRGLVDLAARFYQENTGEEFKRWQHRNFNLFARRYAHLQGKLLPGLLPLIYAARACVDHNYAYEFWDLATFYPWQSNPQDHTQPFDYDGESLSIGGVRLKSFEFHRTFPRLRQAMSRVSVPERMTPSDDPSDWSGAFESGRICSYPPEDIVIEDYGRYLQKKAIKVQSEAHSRTEPFTTSLLDGIDMRTTLRNWADGQKLYVREEKKVQGGTGSVVVIFDEDQSNSKFPWCITWHGEHDQESDMAFYATDKSRKVIGPGIARCEYGGLMLSYPPRRLANVWNDPYYRAAKTKAEVLLFAAIDYCQDKHIVYVGEKVPRSYFFQLAQRLGKKLVYLPIGTLSPTSLERIRVFHVLAGHRYRELAKNFIW